MVINSGKRQLGNIDRMQFKEDIDLVRNLSNFKPIPLKNGWDKNTAKNNLEADKIIKENKDKVVCSEKNKKQRILTGKAVRKMYQMNECKFDYNSKKEVDIERFKKKKHEFQF